MTTRREAQQRIDRVRAFQREVEALRAAGVLVLSDEQRAKVEHYHAALDAEFAHEHDVDADERGKQLSLGMKIASLLGAISLAASVFFFFYRFWGRLATAPQVAILVAAPLLTLALTAWLRLRDSSGYFARLAAMVCFACFVLNISMLGQIFDITPSDKALVVWMAFAGLLAYGVESRLLLVAGILCLDSFIAARFGTWGGAYWVGFGLHPENFLPAAALLLAIPQFIDHRRFDGFAVTYRVFGLLTLYGPILVLSNWGVGSYLALAPSLIEGSYQVLGFVLSAAMIAVGVRASRPEVINTSVSFFVVLLYTKFYDWWWQIMPKYLFFLVIGLTAVLFLFVLRRLREAGRAPHGEGT
jgi:uncharacterized membrane protein